MSNANPFQVPAATANNSNREPSKYWVNIGQSMPDGTFVSFFGLAFDGVKPFKSSNEEVNAIRNAGLAVFQEQFDALKPGETKEISLGGLSIQLRHVGEASQEVDKTAADKLRTLFG